MVSQSRANFGGHRHHCSGEILLLVVEGQESTCTGLNLLLLFISEEHDMSCSYTRSFGM